MINILRWFAWFAEEEDMQKYIFETFKIILFYESYELTIISNLK